MKDLRAQGATEYLVLLAVVLIIALVSVALLGFFPGMASDAQITQSQAYWQSASPIAITEWGALADNSSGGTYPYLRVKNNGAYPVRITAIIGADGNRATQFVGSGCGLFGTAVNISDYFYLAPGEDGYFSVTYSGWYGLPCHRRIAFVASASSGINIGGASSLCANSTSSPGMVLLNSAGFEYIEYIEGQQITKRQIGKQVAIRCMPARYPS
jgi:hypothetical protein